MYSVMYSKVREFQTNSDLINSKHYLNYSPLPCHRNLFKTKLTDKRKYIKYGKPHGLIYFDIN